MHGTLNDARPHDSAGGGSWLVMLCAAFVLLLACRSDAGIVRLTVEEPSGVARTGWPVTSGVPLAQGALNYAQAAALYTANGREVPLQTEVLAKWPDGSVRWLLLDFQVDLEAKQRRAFTLRCGPGVKRQPIKGGLSVSRKGNALMIGTGPMRASLSLEAFRLLDQVWLDRSRDGAFSDDERVTGSDGAGIVLRTPDGKAFRADGAWVKLVVEQSGPLRACVRVEGRHASAGGAMFRYVVRIHAYRGRPFLRIFYTFINDHPDSLMAAIDSLDLVFSLAGSKKVTRVLDGRAGPAGRLFQIDEKQYELDGKAAGKRAAGWAALVGETGGLAVGVREFWQNWPKGIELRDGRLAVGLCPAFAKGLYDSKPLAEENKLYYHLRGGVYTFKVGAARTHELWATFFAGRPETAKLTRFFRAAEEPLLATCEPAYVDSTKVLGDLPPAHAKKYAGYDAAVGRAFDGHLKRRDRGREYGLLNYGDWYGERRVNWGNLEYDLAHGLFLQYLRTGDRRFFARAEQAARHHIDVDVVHATNPHLKNPWGPPPQVGDIWLHCLNHTGGYYEYTKDTPLPVSRTYHMGHSTNFGHVWVSGDLDYYYLTGDRRARDVSVQIADAMLRHMPNRYGTHIRALGWPMILVLAAYEATGEKKYLDAAAKNWQVLRKNLDPKRGWVIRLAKGHCLHPDRRCRGNVPFMEGLTCCALARYHRVTNDPEVLKAVTAGIDQMIRECWQEDVKTFRYTACPLSSKKPYGLFALSAEAFAYEIARTGNAAHRRVLREGLRAMIQTGGVSSSGKGLAQVLFFTPHGLAAMEE